MNNKRRKSLDRAKVHIEQAVDILDFVKDEESNSLDNYPENLQSTDAYIKIEDAVDALGDAIDSLNEAITCVERAAE